MKKLFLFYLFLHITQTCFGQTLYFGANNTLGINTTSPQYSLTFRDNLGDKISFYNGNASNTTNHYGIGIQSSRLQFFTPNSTNDIVFGIGRSAAFTENARFKGNGQVGIGVSTVSNDDRLEINGRLRLRRDLYSSGLWLNNSANETTIDKGVFLGLSNETSGSEVAGFWTNGAWRFGFDREGNATFSGLAGAGTRPLGADANGKLVPLSTNSNIAFAVGLNNSLAVANNGEYLLSFSYEAFDVGNNYIPASGGGDSYFYAETDGVYHFTMNVNWGGNASGRRRIVLRNQNTSLLKWSEMAPPNASPFVQNASCDLYLTAGTKVYFYVFQDSGSNITAGLPFLDPVFFSGYKVN